MTTRNKQDPTKEEKHFKFDTGGKTSNKNDKTIKTTEETKQKNLNTSDNSVTPKKTSNDSKEKLKQEKLDDYGNTKRKTDVSKELKPIVSRPLKQNKRIYTNVFKPIQHRDAETMTDVLKIFETPSNSIVSIFKTSSACLQEIEVMTDLTGDEISKEIGLKDMETSTQDLAKTVLEMNHDLDYINLKLLEGERERKLIDYGATHLDDGLKADDENKLPEESDGIYKNLLERMYICLGISPVEVIKQGDQNEKQLPVQKEKDAVGVEEQEVIKEQESLTSEETECLYQDESGNDAENQSQVSLRSAIVRENSNISTFVDTEEESVPDVENQQKITEDNVVEEKIPNEDVTIKDDDDDDNDNGIDIEEIEEGLMYADLSDAYQFRELFDVDESEVYVEENVDFENEDDLYNEEVRGSNEGWFHMRGEESEVEGSTTSLLVKGATSDEMISVMRKEESDMTFDGNNFTDLSLDQQYHDISEKYLDEEIGEFFQDDVDEESANTVNIDKLVGMVSDYNQDYFIGIDLNYPEYEDQWEISKVIEFLSEDKCVGKILRDFGLFEETDLKHAHATDLCEGDSSTEITYLDRVTKYAEQISDWSAIDAATSKQSKQFRVSMIYSEEGDPHFDEKTIKGFLKQQDSFTNMESWLLSQSRHIDVLEIDQSTYINRSELEYDKDLESRDFNNSSVDELQLKSRSSEEINEKDLKDSSSIELVVSQSLGSYTGMDTHFVSQSLGSYTGMDTNCEEYPRILDQIKKPSRETSSNILKTIQTDRGEKKIIDDDTESLSLDNDNDEDDDDNSDSETNLSGVLSYTDDSVDVIYELIKSDPYGSFMTQKMLNALEYFKKQKFHNEIPHKLKALEALLVKKAARKKFTETLLSKSVRHTDQNLDSYTGKPELFSDSVSVLVWNIFNCFFLPISSKLPQCLSSPQDPYKVKRQTTSKFLPEINEPSKNQVVKPKNISDNAFESNIQMTIKSTKPLVSRANVKKVPVTYNEEHNGVAIQTDNETNDIETPNKQVDDDFVIVRRYRTIEVQTDVSFVTKIKEEEALLEKSFAIHNHTAAQTMEFSPDFAEESCLSLDGTMEDKEEDECYWKNVEDIFADDTLVQEQITKICKKKGRTPIEILITVGKDGKKLFAPLRSQKGLDETIDPRLEQFLSVLKESPVSNLFDDLLPHSVKSEKEGRGSVEGSLTTQIVLESMHSDESRKYGSKGSGSELLQNTEARNSHDSSEQMSTGRSEFGQESGKTDCKAKERDELEDVIKTGIEFLEPSDLDEHSQDSLESSESSHSIGTHSVGSLRRFYLTKFLDTLATSSSFSSIITISEIDECNVEFVSDSGAQHGRQGERTILKGGLLDQKKSVTIFKEITLRDSAPVYDTDNDYQKKKELKLPRKYISFRRKPRAEKPVVVKNWMVKSEKDEWIMVKQYHLFKRIHHNLDMYGSFDQIQKDVEIKKLKGINTASKPIRGILFSYFFPKQTSKFGISAKDKENLEYLRKSDVAWNRIVQKNPERDPYYMNSALPTAFTKTYMKIERNLSHSSLSEKSDHSSFTSPRSESADSNLNLIQLMKMEGSEGSEGLSAVEGLPEETKLDLPVRVYEEYFEPKVDEEVVSNEGNYETFTTDELQNILVDLLIENFVVYGIDNEKTQLEEVTKDVEEIPEIDKSSVEKIDSQIIENEESSSQELNLNSKTEMIKADSIKTSSMEKIDSQIIKNESISQKVNLNSKIEIIMNADSTPDDTADDLSFTESELHLICSQTLRSKRKFEQTDENTVISKRDLRELVSLLSGNSSVDRSSIEFDKEVHFSLENFDCLHQIFSSVQLLEGAKNVVHVSNLNKNHVVKFVKTILKEIYLHILSLNDKERESKLEVGRIHKVESAERLMLYLGELVNKISSQEFYSKYSNNNEVAENKNAFIIFVASNDLEKIRQKFFEQSLPLVKLLERKNLSDKLVFTNSEISLLNMIYLNGQVISKISDQKVEKELNYQDSLMDLIHTVQKNLSNRFCNSSIADIKLALDRFENEWKSSRNLNNQNPEKSEISKWTEKMCSSKHYSHYDRNYLKEVLTKITSKMDHLDRLEEYLESKKYAEKIIDEDEDLLKREIQIFEDDEKTKEAIGALKNILINRILSAEDLFLPTGIEPSVSEVSEVADYRYRTVIDSDSLVEDEIELINEDYSDSKTGDLLLLDTPSLEKCIQKKGTQSFSEPAGSELVPSTIRSSKFPYLKTRQFPFLRRINYKTRILKVMNRECDFRASKRLQPFKLQKYKMLSLVEKCVGKLDFKIIHDSQSKFNRKLTLIRDKKMMYNTHFSYGIGKRTVPMLGRKLREDLEVQNYCRDDEKSVMSMCETCLDTTQSSLSSLSNDLRQPLFSTGSLDGDEISDGADIEDECNKQLKLIRKEIKKSKMFPPLKKAYVMPGIKEVDVNDLSISYMSSIHSRRVRHLKNIVSGNLTDSITSLPPAESFSESAEGESVSRSHHDSIGLTEKSEIKRYFLPEISDLSYIISESKTDSAKSSPSHTSVGKLKLPLIVPATKKEERVSMKIGSRENRRTSSEKSIPNCVMLSKMSDFSLESRQVTRKNTDNYRLVANLNCDYRVRRDLMNLLEEPKKLPVLKPPPEYTPVPGFRKHPLLKFKLDESHVAQVHSFRMEKALKKGQFYKFSKTEEISGKNEVLQFMDPTKCITQPPWFPINFVPRIMQKQVQSQCERFKETVEDCVREVKSIYDTLMFNKAVFDILRVNDKPDFVHQVKLDVGGKTKNHAQFLEKRKRIRDLLFIGHKLIKQTHDSLLENIPNIFVDFRNYRNDREYWDLQELSRTMLNDLKKGCEHFCTVWYVKLDDNFRKTEVLKGMPCDRIKRFMRLVSLILSYEISTAVDRTLKNFTDVFCDKSKVPRLMFKTTLEATEFDRVDLHFCISPELEDIYQVVFNCLHCIFNIGQDLPMLFMSECKPIKRYHKTKVKFIDTNKQDFVLPVNLPVLQNHRLYEECREALNYSIEDNFKALRSYIHNLEHSFAFLTYSNYATSTSSFLNGDKSTKEDVIDLLNILRGYGDKIIRMLPFANFSIGLVKQESTFQYLKVFVNDYIVSCVQTVGRFLKQDYYSLKDEFERVKNRALKPAITSEELVALGDFMSYVQTRWMRDRSVQIVTLSRYYWKIPEFFIMPHSDYCRSLTDWFLWYLEMFPVFDQFATLYEQIKFDFDEKLRDTVTLIDEKRLELVEKIPLLNNLNDVNRIYSYKQFIKRYLRDVEFILAKIEWVNNEEKIYNRTLTKFGQVEELNNILLPFCKLIFKVYSWYQKQKTWLNNSFDLLITEELETTFDRFYKDLLEISKEMKVLCRSLEKDDLKFGVFTGSVDADHEYQLPAPLILCLTTLHNLKEFQPILQLVAVICNKDLLERHWDEMSEIVGQDLTPNAGMSLLKYVDFELFSVIDKLEIISSGATKELQLQNNLRKMYDEWKDLEFSASKFKETDINILTGVDDIQTMLDDHIVKTLAMRSSPFSKPVENEVKTWYDKLVRINKTIDVWGKVQVEWLHLYPIFTSEDIKQQMPKEAKCFADVDMRFRNAIKLLMADRRAIVVGPAEGLLESLEVCLELMEEINNGVNLYLESKRLYFPRFFFLSNDEMLEILSQTTDPLRVQPHLKKCFEGIASLGFNESLDIYSMMSSEKEEITFIRKVSTYAARGSVEKWLVQVEKQMLRSVRHVIKESFNAYKYHERKQWVRAWPGQVVLCVSQSFWTAEVHRVLRKQHSRAVYLYHKKLNKQLSDVIQLVRGKLSLMARITLGALVVLDVHAKDVTYGLYVKGIINERDFEWMAQLRYYWDNDMIVSIINASVDYAYEYLGNTARLVITPLTDRCYRTLVGAYHLHLNGAPEGPAGTGKTETTKDLAKALAVQCIVFNCSDGLDYIAMGKFFKGLASCGAWACFDEFNRIEVEVLSVVAQQILCIVQAVRKNVKEFAFEGTTLTLNPACYVCITMNPGYAGRSELPDNLKVLFRTVAMMVPDYGLIGEISLYSCGFINARKLSEKIVTTYRLCSEQLSSQSHYDYGMRAVKTVLQAAGNLKLKFPKQSEEVLLLRSIMDVNLPKFLNHDVPLFEGIISDLFPGVKLPTPNYDKFIGAIKKSCEQHSLQPSPPFITKIIQTYEMMVVRHGFMLVGDPFSGKTSTLHVLADAITFLTNRKRVVKYQTLNPKSVTMGQLYGKFDDVSHEWSDGVLANAFREFAMSTSDERKWVIFDGPVDAVWIENMNTVLDDNKKLCLNSGEVITMTWSMSMIFEVMDLAQASPATVSRCGMIYMESSTLGWTVLVDSWLTCLPDSIAPHADTLAPITKWMIPPCLTFCRKHCINQLNAGVSNIVRSFCNYITVFLSSAILEHDVNQFNTNALAWIQAAAILSAIWAFSGTLDADSRMRFDVFLKDLVQGEIIDHEPPEAMSKLISSVPSDGIWEDNFFVFKGRGFWSSWAELAQTAKITPLDNLSQLVVPTLETVKYQYVIEKLIQNFLPVCLMGPTGTGKSFYIDDLMTTKLSLQKFEPSSMTFTVNTQPNLVQTVVLSKLIKRKKSIFGPPIGKHCLIFIDDMNMPAKEVYGAQPPLELLRMYFDHGYWFDLKDMNKIFVEDLFFVAAMGPAGGSRQDVYARFLRHFCLLSINLFTEQSMTKIYGTLLFEAMRRKGFGVDFMNLFRATVTATINVYQKSILNLLPTPAKSHYTFNLRDISRVINGVMMFKKESYRDKPDFISLWLHEMLRVFSDRLVESNDRKWFFTQLKENVKSTFRTTMEETLKDMKHEGEEVTEEDMTHLMFTSIFDLDEPVDKLYEQVFDMEPFTKIIQDNLDTYNHMHKTKIDIVLFRYALVHLSRILRLLSMPGGNALLVGVAGSGRQSLTMLAASIFRLAVFQPEIKELYEFNEWRDDLKVVMKECGGRGNPMVFLFTENQIKHEYFLQDIDVLLNTGEVPNIFSLEETQEVLELARLGAQGGNRNLDVHPLSVLSYFRSQCKRNIHLMICFSPIGNTFRNRIRLYPAFVNCCTIDWFEDWPENALEKVAERYFDSNKFDEKIKHSLVNACKYIHITTRQQAEEFFLNTGRKTYITSGSYLNLIRLYTNLFEVKQKEVMEAKMRYITGLDSLQFAADQISVMKQELEALQPQLKRAAEAAEQMMREINAETAQVEAATQLVQRDEVVAEAKARDANLLKQECQVELAATIPILNEALAALNTLKPNDITVVKAMKNPPKTVKLVMAAVCIMMGIKAAKVPDQNNPGRFKMDFWIPSVRLLGNINFLKNLKEYDKDTISPAVMTIIRREYIPNKEFNPATVKKASKAAEGLCKWVIAMEQYDEVIKIVAPKKERMEKAEQSYERTMTELNDKKALLKGFEEKLALLQERLQQTMALKAQLTEEANMCWEKLQRAQQLIGGLGGEKERWTEAANSLQRAFDNLAGDMLLSSAFIAYLGPFTTAYRHPLINNWKQKTGDLSIPRSSDFDFISLVGKSHVIQQWHLDGLPKDKFSVENGVVMASTNRYTFLIDPEGQANRWLKTMYMDSNMEVLKISDKQLMKKVEMGILYGQPVLLEDVGEELDACLDPILLRITFKQGGRDYITIGTKVIELHKDFNLFITTRLRCPHFLPEVLNKVTVINFALTKEALEDQLLAIAITILSPELEARRASMIVQSALNAKALRNAEEDILRALSAPDKNVLEDENTVIILNESQKIAADIKEREKGTIETSNRISEFNASFAQPVVYARSLYYCLTDLPNIDPMYHFSLPWFLRIYSGSLKADYDHFVEVSNKREPMKTNARFMPNMTSSLYSNVCRSLFEKDKLLFSFILCTNLMLTESKIRMEDLSFLLTGGVVLVNLIPNPAPDWILIRSWDELCRLTLLDGFQGLKEHVEKNLRIWRMYYDKAEPHMEPLPEPWNSVLTPFQKLLVLRIFHLDKMVPAIRNFVELEMDETFVTPPLFDIAESYKDSNKVTPMVFILSPGVDPMSALQQFAEKMGYKESEFESVSLGQGQGPIAENLIKKARMGGTWVCLQNCHLATSWMPTLEAICDDLVFSTKDGFRLWLTSYPSDKFPVPILQNGVKMTNEPPTGLKQNMLRTFTSEPITDQEFYNACNADDVKQFVFARLLFGLTFFHAVVLERKKYGPIGWNIPYGFNESDYNISVLQLQEYMVESEEVPFEAVTYLTGECNYGGRVTDNWDRRTLNTILASFVNAHIAANEDYYMLDNFSELLVNSDRHEFEYYIGVIENISDVQPAEVVGLNSNASISRDFHSTKALFEAMQLVQPKTRGGGSSKKEDEMVITITSDILQKLPPTFDLDLALQRYPVNYSESMNTVLVQEMERFNRLTGVVRSSIRMLQRAIRGAAVMTPDLEATFSSVLANRLPGAWAKVSYPSLKPLAEYVADLIRRLRLLQDWCDHGIPSCFWVSGFFFTQAFLTAAMQNYARKQVIPIDLLTFDFVMTSYNSPNDVTQPPEDGVYVHGLFLEGARWDRQMSQLEEQMPKILFDIMPVIHFVPKQKKHAKEDGRYVCPLYKTSERRGILSTTGHSTNYVLPLLLACSRTPAHWVKRGTALLCQLDN